MTPDGIPVAQPLVLTVALEGLVADAVEVDFQGVDMNMGYNRVRLARAPDGRFSGEAMLPACIRGAMSWQATITLDMDDGPWEAAFFFDTFAVR